MKKKQDIQTILPDHIMEQVADATAAYLNAWGVRHYRDGTLFYVPENKMNLLAGAQYQANLKLLKEGVLTPEMLLKDYKHNFLSR